jgi:predicted transcriptional regulator
MSVPPVVVTANAVEVAQLLQKLGIEGARCFSLEVVVAPGEIVKATAELAVGPEAMEELARWEWVAVRPPAPYDAMADLEERFRRIEEDVRDKFRKLAERQAAARANALVASNCRITFSPHSM